MQIRRIRPLRVALVCLAFTAPAVAWADSPPPRRGVAYVEDPYAPHHTSGSTVRVGTAVGVVAGERHDVTAVGGTVAAGQRFGRFTLEAEYAYLAFQEQGASSLQLGDGQRLGVLARYDVVRLGPRVVGGNSLVAFYVEGGSAVAWNHWYKPAYDEVSRLVPDDTKRVEGQIGFGIQLDHRLQEPIGFPHRIGWFLGWRMALAPHAPDTASVCRANSCRRAPTMTHDGYTDRSMLFQSSLAVTW